MLLLARLWVTQQVPLALLIGLTAAQTGVGMACLSTIIVRGARLRKGEVLPQIDVVTGCQSMSTADDANPSRTSVGIDAATGCPKMSIVRLANGTITNSNS